MEELDTYIGVMVAGVEIVGEDIQVDVYGSDEYIVASLTYKVSDPERRKVIARTLARWAAEDRPITYFRAASGESRLVSDSEVDRYDDRFEAGI